eukprot:jgi/Tetstr1/434711/TSEL_002538.t1
MFDFAMAAVACIILAHFAPTESQVARAMPPEDMPDLAGARPVETIEASGNATSNMTAADQAKILKMSSGDIAHEQLWDQLSEEDMCTRWRGVFCTEDGLLRGILVEDETGMSGQRLPPEWGNLTTLRFIILVENDLTGPLPAEWSKLTNLIMLDLADNRLTGSLPEAWSAFSDLRFLSLEGNELNGSLPESWSAMTSIKDLQLDDNMLLGPERHPRSPAIGRVSAIGIAYVLVGMYIVARYARAGPEPGGDRRRPWAAFRVTSLPVIHPGPEP